MKLFLMLMSTVLLISTSPLDKNVDNKPVSERVYSIIDIEGWSFWVNIDVISTPNWSSFHRLVSNQLYDMKRVMKDDVISKMQKIKIYVDLKNEANNGAEYHPDKQWLIENGISENKAQCVEITDIDTFVDDYSKYQPCVLLHELMHGYHHQFLSFENPEVIELYKNAVTSGKYDNVLHAKGNKFRHYALSNEMEYLSEAAEAFFGVNDFYPFVRSELKEVDPKVHAFLSKLAK